MAYGPIDKSFGGTPGLIFRLRLELGMGNRSPKDRRTLLHSLYSLERAMFPAEDEIPAGCTESLPDLMKDLKQQLHDLVVRVINYGEDVPIPPADEVVITHLLDAVTEQIDEVMYRGKLIESVRPAQGPAVP